MKKITIISIISIAICISLVLTIGCQFGIKPQSIYVRFSEADSHSLPIGTVSRDIKKTNLIDLTQMDELDFDMFVLNLYSRVDSENLEFDQNKSSKMYTLGGYYRSFPFQYIEKIDSSHIGIVYKLKDENQSCFIFIVFEREVYYNLDENNGFLGFYEDWGPPMTGEYYFVTDKLSFNDFKSISIGDSAYKVAEIDKSTFFDFSEKYTEKTEEGNRICYSYKILSDGVLKIKYTNNISDSIDITDFSISEICFYEYSHSMPQWISIKTAPKFFSKL